MINNKNLPIVYFITTTFFMAIGYSSIYKICSSDSWIALIIGSILTILVLPLINKLKNNLFSKKIYVLYNLFIILISLMILRIFTTSFYLTKTPGILITLPFIILSIYNSKKGLNTICKESQILLFFCIIVIVCNMIAASKSGSITNLLPIFITSKKNIIKGSLVYFILTTSPQFLIKEININTKDYIKTMLLSHIILVFIGTITIFILGPNLIKIYRFPEYMILKEINLFNFIENVENLVGLIWFFNIFISCSIAAYNIKNNLNNKYLSACMIISMALLCEYLSDKYIYALFIYRYLPLILLIIIFVIIISSKKAA